MIVSDLVVYPIKGCGGYSVTSSAVDLTGLHGDRTMMLVDDEGVFLSQRKVPAMAALRATGDAIESQVAADLWPLPTYRDLLFLK